MNQSRGRRLILRLVFSTLISALAVLLIKARGGAISAQTLMPAAQAILQIYVPIIAIMGGFYWAERGVVEEPKRTSPESFFLSIAVIALWLASPPLLIGFCETIETALRHLKNLEVFGQSATAGAIGFYFAKGK